MKKTRSSVTSKAIPTVIASVSCVLALWVCLGAAPLYATDEGNIAQQPLTVTETSDSLPAEQPVEEVTTDETEALDEAVTDEIEATDEVITEGTEASEEVVTEAVEEPAPSRTVTVENSLLPQQQPASNSSYRSNGGGGNGGGGGGGNGGGGGASSYQATPQYKLEIYTGSNGVWQYSTGGASKYLCAHNPGFGSNLFILSIGDRVLIDGYEYTLTEVGRMYGGNNYPNSPYDYAGIDYYTGADLSYYYTNSPAVVMQTCTGDDATVWMYCFN